MFLKSVVDSFFLSLLFSLIPVFIVFRKEFKDVKSIGYIYTLTLVTLAQLPLNLLKFYFNYNLFYINNEIWIVYCLVTTIICGLIVVKFLMDDLLSRDFILVVIIFSVLIVIGIIDLF